ncbi:MAG: amidohydrolase family protein [Bacteroidota bacterium]
MDNNHKIECIDAHVHISDNGMWGKSFIKSSVNDLLRVMDESNISKSILLPIHGMCTNENIFHACDSYPDRLIGFVTVDMSNISLAIDELIKIKGKYNVKGVKLHPRLQCFSPNDKKLYPLYESISGLGLPIIFDGFLQSSTIPMQDLIPERYDALAKKFRDMTIILAHMGGHRYWDAYFAAKSNPNIFLDTSYIVNYFKKIPSKVDEFKFIFNTLDRKIIFGSDYPELNPSEEKKLLKSIIDDLPLDKKKNIFSNNIIRILSEK